MEPHGDVEGHLGQGGEEVGEREHFARIIRHFAGCAARHRFPIDSCGAGLAGNMPARASRMLALLLRPPHHAVDARKRLFFT